MSAVRLEEESGEKYYCACICVGMCVLHSLTMGGFEAVRHLLKVLFLIT